MARHWPAVSLLVNQNSERFPLETAREIAI